MCTSAHIGKSTSPGRIIRRVDVKPAATARVRLSRIFHRSSPKWIAHWQRIFNKARKAELLAEGATPGWRSSTLLERKGSCLSVFLAERIIVRIAGRMTEYDRCRNASLKKLRNFETSNDGTCFSLLRRQDKIVFEIKKMKNRTFLPTLQKITASPAFVFRTSELRTFLMIRYDKKADRACRLRPRLSCSRLYCLCGKKLSKKDDDWNWKWNAH